MKYTLYHLDKIGLSLEGMMVFKFQKCYKAHFILLPAIYANNHILSREPFPRKIDSKITILPWKIFFEMLWDGEII